MTHIQVQNWKGKKVLVMPFSKMHTRVTHSHKQRNNLFFKLPVLKSDDDQVRETARSSLALHVQKKKETLGALCGDQKAVTKDLQKKPS